MKRFKIIFLVCVALLTSGVIYASLNKIAAGDKLSIWVKGEPDLSVLKIVARDGSISMPLIGSVGVSGLSTGGASRVIAEMLEDGKQKDRLISTFQRLEGLLNEFTAIEQISVNGQHLQKRVYRIIDIIDEAIDISMVPNTQIEQMIQSDLSIKVDFKLFTVAIKNMIDNGVKYSHDNHIKLSANFKSIQFASMGTKLPNELSYYTEPFTQGEKQSPQSFGLGLYIVDSILKTHQMELTYEYSNGYNIFKFIKIQPIV